MKIEVIRRIYSEKTTIGDLYIDGKFICNTLEDKVRAPGETKIWGETAIPAGEYSTTVTYSPKFGQQMAELLGIPGFSKVRIHSGNKDADTEGCILVGTYSQKKPDWISNSRDAYALVWTHIWRAFVHKEAITVTVSDTKDFTKSQPISKAKAKTK